MIIRKIIHDGREYVPATVAAAEAYVNCETLRVHSKRGAVPYIEHEGRRWYDLEEVRAYFAKPTKSGHTKMYKIDDFMIGGRVYHPYRWYTDRYRVHHYHLVSLPSVDRGSRVKLIAEEDFNASPLVYRRRKDGTVD